MHAADDVHNGQPGPSDSSGANLEGQQYTFPNTELQGREASPQHHESTQDLLAETNELESSASEEKEYEEEEKDTVAVTFRTIWMKMM